MSKDSKEKPTEDKMEWHNIGRRVNEARKERGFTQERLAEAADLSAVCISNIERGRKKASLESMIRIATALEVTVDSLVYGSRSADQNAYYPEVHELLENSSLKERRVLLETAKALKTILRNNEWVA